MVISKLSVTFIFNVILPKLEQKGNDRTDSVQIPVEQSTQQIKPNKKSRVLTREITMSGGQSDLFDKLEKIHKELKINGEIQLNTSNH